MRRLMWAVVAVVALGWGCTPGDGDGGAADAVTDAGGIALVLRGVGLWTPGFADAAGWSSRHVSGDMPTPEAPAAETPRAELLPPMLRRRTSLLTRMAAEVAAQGFPASPAGTGAGGSAVRRSPWRKRHVRKDMPPEPGASRANAAASGP